jgi:hypothetical protein
MLCVFYQKKKKKKIALPHQLALCSPGCPQIILFVLGFEFTFTRQALYHLSHFTSPFFLGFFKIGALELFAQAGFKQQSS